MLPFLIGCDGGGTGCRVAIADVSGKLLAEGVGGPANATSDFDLAIRNVRAALDVAAGKLDLTGPDLAGAWVHVGLAGVLASDSAARVAAALPFTNITVSEDRLIALEGALGADDGVLIAIGTGTIIAGRREAILSHIGGWGLQVSDQASGAWLGRAVLERVLLCHDGLVPPCDLTRSIFAGFNNDPAQIVGFAATARPADYAGFAPAVVAAAKAADAGGVALMQRGADYLTSALGVLGLRPGDRLCLTGGIGPHYAGFLSDQARAALHPPRGSALQGALQLAKAAYARGQGG
ncbi:BadF/BadG/BcrA/BcrD ATPase family protein [Pseudorhodobacter sp.]|uniref:BadF/BadG/BcrA/BcrD ATPase family protein n=1 Tax=Pseudorhodobacter sp. TaxID=1934400 RepID=UPI0026486692|nr:BadF/BadG/BcrA/BcrD ATPase family protein [Pseudorhodobacter sp.]MDN5787523.1 N-acetylglucosamine kinase [Pseudorhodobacter sp.]